MRFIIATILISLSMSLIAQNSELLKGKWQYQDFVGKQDMDSMRIAMTHKMLESMTFYFAESGQYKFVLMGLEDQGTWHMNEDGKSATLKSINGVISTIQILELEENKLVIQVKKDTYVMGRTKPNKADDEFIEIQEIPGVSATKAQIAKKWYFVSKVSAGKTEQQIQMMSKLIKGSFMIFKPNGEYELEIMGIEESGSWKFGEGQSTIITTVEGQSKIWNISRVSDKLLILVKGQLGEKWIFSDQP